MSSLPPPAVGDPAGMRALAGRLRGQAGQIAHEAQTVARQGRATSWIGPAATDFETLLASWLGDLTVAADDLLNAASALERSATLVEQEQAARARLERQLLEEQARSK